MEFDVDPQSRAGATPILKTKPAGLETAPAEAAEYIHTQLKSLVQIAQEYDLD
jgi:hypothetical protein